MLLRSPTEEVSSSLSLMREGKKNGTEHTMPPDSLIKLYKRKLVVNRKALLFLRQILLLLREFEGYLLRMVVNFFNLAGVVPVIFRKALIK
jgi:hypothetical protein